MQWQNALCQRSFSRLLLPARRSWHLGNATKMLKETLAWRCQYKPHDIKWEDVQEEGVTGKQMIMPAVSLGAAFAVFAISLLYL